MQTVAGYLRRFIVLFPVEKSEAFHSIYRYQKLIGKTPSQETKKPPVKMAWYFGIILA